MKRQGDLIAAEKVITWTVASNCLMMQWARGKRNQWTVKMCAMYAIYTYPGCYQATHQAKQKRWRWIIKVHNFIWHNFWIIILSKTLGSSSSMILFNNRMDHRKTKDLSYVQMLSELDAIKYMATLANKIISHDVVRLTGWSAIRKYLLTLVQNNTKCRCGLYNDLMIIIWQYNDQHRTSRWWPEDAWIKHTMTWYIPKQATCKRKNQGRRSASAGYVGNWSSASGSTAVKPGHW